MEKLLLEACLEVLETGALIGLQDMGAAGLSCATSEMSARGHMGMDVEVTTVPQRETGMTPYEIMLSESQERMLFVVHEGPRGRRRAHLREVGPARRAHRAGHRRWTGARARARQGRRRGAGARAGRRSAAVRPAQPASGVAGRTAAPAAVRLQGVSADRRACSRRCSPRRPSPARSGSTGSTTTWCGPTRCAWPGAARRWCRVKGTDRALAISLDGNGRYGQVDPKRGAMLAVAEAARNVALAGGVPIGATNNLNFGNPEKPEIMWQFVEAVAGIGEACRAFGVPITGGNVSLYNETDGKAIYPTPVLGIVGLIEDASHDRRPDVPRRRSEDRAARRDAGRTRRHRVPAADPWRGARHAAGASTSAMSSALQTAAATAHRRGAGGLGARLCGRRAGGGAVGVHVRRIAGRRDGDGGRRDWSCWRAGRACDIVQ